MLKKSLLGAALLLAAACNSGAQPVASGEQPSLGLRPLIMVPPSEFLPLMDSYTLNELSIDGNILTATVTTPESCKMHEWWLFWDGSVNELSGEAQLTLVHQANGNHFCDNPFLEILRFDLTSAAETGLDNLSLRILGGDVEKSIAFQPIKPPGPRVLAFGQTAKIVVDEQVETVEVAIPREGLHKLPVVAVAEASAGFECEIVKLTKTTKLDAAVNLVVDTYRMGIGWVAAVDPSGCLVEIKNPYNDQIATAQLVTSF